MIKNFIIFSDYAYVCGGAGKVAFDCAIALSKRGYNVTFFSGTGPKSSLLADNQIKCICLNQPDMLSDKNKLFAACRSLWNYKAYKETLSLLSSYNKNDTVIMVHGYAKTLSSSIFAAFKKKDFKVMLFLHDYFAVCPNGSFYNYQTGKICHLRPLSLECLTCNCDVRSYPQKIYRYIRQIFVRHNLKDNSDNLFVFCVSELSKQIMKPYIGQYFHSFETMLNPVDINNLGYVDISKNKKYIYIGRLSEEKGIRDFCDVITALKLEGIALGDGYLKDELIKKYPNVKFVGWVDGENKYKYIRQSKCLIFPSKIQETFGLAIPEMLSIGIPCIAPAECGASYLIKDDVNGLTYPIGDYESLKERVKKFEIANIEKIMNSTRKNFDNSCFSIECYIKRMENACVKVFKG